jgi:hypothetical protein
MADADYKTEPVVPVCEPMLRMIAIRPEFYSVRKKKEKERKREKRKRLLRRPINVASHQGAVVSLCASGKSQCRGIDSFESRIAAASRK